MKKSLWTKRYVLALAIMFGVFLSSNIVLSVMSIFAKNISGLDIYAGMMTSLFTVAALAVRFFAGTLIDKFNCKKVLIAGVLMMAVASAFFINSANMIYVCIYRCVQGIGFGLASTGAATYVAKTANPTRLLEGVSYGAIANSLSALIGPAIAFALIGANYDKFQVLFVLTVFIGIGTLALSFIVKDVKNESDTQSTNTVEAKIQWKNILIPVYILFANALAQSGLISFIGLYAISLSFTGAGSFFTINAAGMIISRLFMNKVIKRLGETPMIIANTLLFSICIFLLANVRSMTQMLIIAFPAGFAMGTISPLVNTMIINNMPSSKKGIANAVYLGCLDIGFAAGPFIFGLIATYLKYSDIFLVAAFIQSASVLIAFVQMRLSRYRTLKFKQMDFRE